MNCISLTLSILALIISSIVAFLHYRRDRRESTKFKSDNEQVRKKIRFSISEINYSLERGQEGTGEYYEDHLVTFDVFIQSIGNPPIHLDKIGVIFTKPLVGEKVRTFTFDVPNSRNKIEKGERYPLRFAQAFVSKEFAYMVINSQIEIKCSDLDGEIFSSGLLNPTFGDSI